MTKMIFITVALGLGFGHFAAPDLLIDWSDTIIAAGLSLILFLVGMDIGRQEGLLESIRRCGIAILMVPFMTITGTLTGTAIAGVLIGVSPVEGAMVGAGLGWYTLAPSIIASYSTELSAICFLANVFRELLTILLISLVASKIGYFEATCMGGAATMDALLPVVQQATESRMAVYSFVSGMCMSIAVPILIPLLIAIA